MKKALFLLLLITSACKTSTLAPDQAIEKLGPNPHMQIDDKALASPAEVQNYDAKDIASVETIYGRNATAIFGDKAKDGAVVIVTKSYAREKYRTFFSSVSKEYNEVIDEVNEDDIQYILNDNVLVNDFEGDLSTINKKRLKKITIINQAELESKYGTIDKKVGVVISATPPANLHNAKKKF
ncbi:hypothetical protein [Cesiribacter sp. SM1]|uniref:hypothetical protein n=1 Tax=Cesiribacter sp. SM1 TaxID=2861196 RepID=UPI001CD6D1BC|nr:hypothetical protein [Cesiribacter sp. SM1]